MRRKTATDLVILVLAATMGCAHVADDFAGDSAPGNRVTSADHASQPAERSRARLASNCPRGTRLFCTRRVRQERCACLDDAEFRDTLRSMFE